jgi:enoyl-CoA hydratase/carnithine racemase
MLVRLADAGERIDGDPEIRVAILTGAGGHFCAGSDLKAMAGGWTADGPLPRANSVGVAVSRVATRLPFFEGVVPLRAPLRCRVDLSRRRAKIPRRK